MNILSIKSSSVKPATRGGVADISAQPAAVRRPFSPRQLLQINIAVLAPLGTLLLSMGEREMLLATIMFVAAVSSVFLTDLWGWIRLNRAIANLAALAATAVCVFNFTSATSEEQLVVIANLLVYLQVVLLFQKKNIRLYWQLLVLSVLEVVVATALNSSLLFGVLLIVYLFVALATLGLLFIERETEHYTIAVAEFAKKSRRPRKSSEFLQTQREPPPRRWPAMRPIEITSVAPPNLAQQMLGPGLMWRTSFIGVGTLIVAAISFFCLPRFSRTLIDPTLPQTTIGYTSTVKLGDLGPMLQNPELVMQIEFRDEATDAAIAPAEAPLLRGSLVTKYENGQWTNDKPRGRIGRPPRRPQGAAGLIRQRATIHPLKEPVLFAVYPPYAADTTRDVQYDPERQQLMRGSVNEIRNASEVAPHEFDYELLTNGFWKMRQARIVPPLRDDEHNPEQLMQLKQMPKGLTGLTAAAAAQIAAKQISADDHYAVAKALESYLAAPPFTYSLDRPPIAPGADPIDDFVTRNRSGHCEYFASALTLMLRSLDIPARMVIGYRGGDWNSVGQYYDVRQLHAHAWVEAFLEPEQVAKVPPTNLPPGIDPKRGAWLVLDPTPILQADDVNAEKSFYSSLVGMADYMQMLWNTYVVGLNSDRQDKAIYQPLADFWHALQRLFSDPKKTLFDTAKHFWHWLFGGGEAGAGKLDWYVVAALGVLIALAVVLLKLIRWMARLISRRWGRRGTGRVQRAIAAVEFYRRLEALLARQGLRRLPQQTQREFVATAVGKLHSRLGPSHVAGLRQLAETFYGVRFGGVALDSGQSQIVEQGLVEIAAALRNRKT